MRAKNPGTTTAARRRRSQAGSPKRAAPSASLEPEQLQARATAITFILKQMQEEHGEYRDFGIND